MAIDGCRSDLLDRYVDRLSEATTVEIPPPTHKEW